MKFIDFGDLVEVTYDDGSIELISKEKAAELGYKPTRVIEIAYKDRIYSATGLSKIININQTTIRDYYDKGLRTGEEILTYYNRNK